MAEAVLMAQLEHDHVCALHGVYFEHNNVCLVLEFCEYGNLRTYIQAQTYTHNEKFVLRVASEVASGLAYLSARNFVHRDIAARNVLLSSDYSAKIADFGMSRDTDNAEYYRAHSGQVPVRWSAPEALEQLKFSAASDCWSYGVMLHETFTKGALPYEGWSNQKVWVSVLAGYRLPRGPGCPPDVYEQMLMCWAPSPEHRPSFEVLAAFFQSKLAQSLADTDEAPADFVNPLFGQNAADIGLYEEPRGGQACADAGKLAPRTQPRVPAARDQELDAYDQPLDTAPYEQVQEPAAYEEPRGSPCEQPHLPSPSDNSEPSRYLGLTSVAGTVIEAYDEVEPSSTIIRVGSVDSGLRNGRGSSPSHLRPPRHEPNFMDIPEDAVVAPGLMRSNTVWMKGNRPLSTLSTSSAGSFVDHVYSQTDSMDGLYTLGGRANCPRSPVPDDDNNNNSDNNNNTGQRSRPVNANPAYEQRVPVQDDYTMILA